MIEEKKTDFIDIKEDNGTKDSFRFYKIEENDAANLEVLFSNPVIT